MERCAGCGLEIAGGTDGCQALFDELRLRERELATGYASTRLTIDVYCLQHPDRYCVSAKSLAAHLTGVAWALDHGGSPRGLEMLQRWLNHPGELIKPALPAARGDLTIADLAAANGPGDYADRLRRWAERTWAAYSDLQPVAGEWIRRALGS